MVQRLTMILIMLLSTLGRAAADPSPQAWEVAKSDHFVVYFHDAPPRYLDQLIARAERHYHQITTQLGFTRFDGFWTWEERAKIYLYRDRDEYQRMTHQPEWSEAGANVVERELHTYVEMEDFLELVLPHELGHIIFREFIGSRRPLPLWLDEGIACFLEEGRKSARLTAAKALVDSERFIPLERLCALRKEQLVEPEPFYAEAASLIEFLFRQHGQERFVDYCRRMRDGQEWRDALKTVYGFRNLSEMEEAWVAFLKSSP
ncbi:MAG: peptidase MA family metallohydrolase [Candidatus Omnitrophota bacterium]|nr:peptidase MA family metallohydrolase [Candidatus Omnitrophota bacterium]